MIYFLRSARYRRKMPLCTLLIILRPSIAYFMSWKAEIWFRRLPGRPRRFAALPLESGLQSAYLSQQRQTRDLLSQIISGGDELAVILLGRRRVYEAYERYAAQAQKQVSVYSIGVAYSDTIAKRQAELIGRGIPIRHVFQELKPENYHIAAKWQKIGVDLRLLAAPRGYHLTIVDTTCAIVSFSNSSDTEQRVSMLTTNPDTIAIFQAQFDQIWQKAAPISI